MKLVKCDIGLSGWVPQRYTMSSSRRLVLSGGRGSQKVRSFFAVKTSKY